jgi:CheY-like chemotaxis protein
MSSANSKISHLTILIVDDEPDSVAVASDLLAFYGAEVHTALDGRHAMEMLEKIKPDLVLSDLSMPKVDGWELIEMIRRNPATAHLPVIALTANALPKDKERGLAAGFTSYLTKPIKALTLLDDIMQRVPSLAADS